MTKLEQLYRECGIKMSTEEINGHYVPSFHRDDTILCLNGFFIPEGSEAVDVFESILENCVNVECTESFAELHENFVCANGIFSQRWTKAQYAMWKAYAPMVREFLGDMYEEFMCAPHKE